MSYTPTMEETVEAMASEASFDATTWSYTVLANGAIIFGLAAMITATYLIYNKLNKPNACRNLLPCSMFDVDVKEYRPANPFGEPSESSPLLLHNQREGSFQLRDFSASTRDSSIATTGTAGAETAELPADNPLTPSQWEYPESQLPNAKRH